MKEEGEARRKEGKMPMSFKGTSKNLFSVNLLVNEEEEEQERMGKREREGRKRILSSLT